MRISGALFRAAGTAWGLVAAVSDVTTNGLRTRVLVRPGLAVDALGRELYVDREQCLDVDGLAQHPIWRELVAPDGSTAGTARRAYIVLRHEVCLVEANASVAQGRGDCAAPRGGGSYDHFRIELCPSAPPEPSQLRRSSFAELACAEHRELPRDVFLDFFLQERSAVPAAREPIATRPDVAPLLLATLDLDTSGATTFIVESTPAAPNPDNRVRAMLPGARVLAEHLFGKRGARRVV
jgi:hypothetical protein